MTIRNYLVKLIGTWTRLVEPRRSGLPNGLVLLWFPVLAALCVTALVVLQLSGTSSGVHWFQMGTGTDPRLLFGIPRGIRSDEWLVQQGWVVSQANSGFSAINHMFPGGTDVTVLNELPSWDWSTLFRPHLWGYLLFGLDFGIAWYWWLPALGVVSGCYVFVVTILPRRPFTAALLAGVVLLTPMLQWFYSSNSLWAVAWSLLGMTSIVWILRDSRRWVRITWSILVGYLAVTMVMGLYVPYVIPVIFVFFAFAIGYLLRQRPWKHESIPHVLATIAPLLVAGIATGLVVLVWVWTRASTFSAILSTVYPGQRSLSTGQILKDDPYLIGLAGAPWNEALKASSSSVLGGNSSEGSSVLLICLFVLPGLIWFLLGRFRKDRRVDWLLAMCIGGLLVIAAYLFVPGWDGLARILQFDKVPPERFRIAFVVMIPLFVTLVVERVDSRRASRTWIPGLVSAGLTATFLLILWSRIKRLDPEVLAWAGSWKLIVTLLVAATFLLFVRHAASVAVAMLLVVSGLIGWGVNPVYRGIYDLSETTIGKSVEQANNRNPGTWVAIGSAEATAVLVESAVSSLSGVQTYPAQRMWREIDPTSRDENRWNRLAHVSWSLGVGPVKVTNPQTDVIGLTLDPCSSFAQRHVQYVLSDNTALESPCLLKLDSVRQGNLRMAIFRVAGAGG